jgi:drug/metabolite transporter (DMT)-like permease
VAAKPFGWAALLPLGCMASNSLFQLLTSHLGRSDNPATTHFYTTWVGATLSTLALPLSWVLVDAPSLWLLMLLMGLLGAVGHFVLALAFQRAPAATLMPYMYGQVGFAVLAGWLVFAHVPDQGAIAGIALIALCGVGAAWLTARAKRLADPLPAP